MRLPTWPPSGSPDTRLVLLRSVLMAIWSRRRALADAVGRGWVDVTLRDGVRSIRAALGGAR